MINTDKKCPKCGTELVIGADWGEVAMTGTMPNLSLKPRCPNKQCDEAKGPDRGAKP